MKKIVIIAGEASGDKIGARIIKSLNQIGPCHFLAVGGEEMARQNVTSLFPMEDISLMGFAEILPHIFKLKKRIAQTVQAIKDFAPDIVVTIDSPGFCYRVATLLKGNFSGKLVHIVAPSVWAYKPERAAKFAKIYDLLLTLLPFEPPYFTKEGLDTKFIGHFIFEQDLCHDPNIFKEKYKLNLSDKLICITPGSRVGEVRKHLAIFLSAIMKVREEIDVNIVIVAASQKIEDLIRDEIMKRGINNIIITQDDKFAAYKASDVALAKSGTNSLEIAQHGTPQIICYKLNFLSWFYIKSMIKIKFANLINIIADKEIIPELLQDKCNPDEIAQELMRLLTQLQVRDMQVESVQSILETLKNPEGPASVIAAKEIVHLIN